MSHQEITQLPKIELHRHLEGCIDEDFLRQHLRDNFPDHFLLQSDRIRDLFNYGDFMGFLNSWGTVMNFLTDLEHFRGVVQHASKQLKAENIRYAELIFSPQPFIRSGIDPEQLFELLIDEFKAQKVEMRFIIDFVRNFGAKAMSKDLTELIELKKRDEEFSHWVRAISIGGDEVNYPAPLFEEPFKQAREEGFHIYAHAGEWLGADSVWDSINYLGVERIGHGVNSVKDPTLLKYLRENNIALDISITSNYLTESVKGGDSHPVKAIYDNNCAISLNTDDPGFFHTDLNEEYQRFIDMGYEIRDLNRIVQNAIDHAFLSEDEQETVHRLLR